MQVTSGLPANFGRGLAGIFIENNDIEEEFAFNLFLARPVFLDALPGCPISNIFIQ
jgi:hypothetical protein